MKKSSKIIVILLVLILIAILGLGGYVICDLNNRVEEQANTINELEGSVAQSASEEVANINENESNTVNSTSANSVTANSTVEDVADTETVEMSIEDKICSVMYLEDFDDGQSLADEEYLSIVSMVLDYGYVNGLSDRKNNDEGYGEYTVDEINSVIYCLFNVNLSNEKSSYAFLEYEDGKYISYGGGSTEVPTLKNVEMETDGNTKTVNFDYYIGDYSDPDYETYEGKYEVVLKLNSETGNYYVQSKNLVE